jgi:hypothetical protein
MYAAGSRYQSVPTGVFTDREGRKIVYTLLRITPDAPAIQAHIVAQGDRLDLIAATYYTDAEQYWRICDGNNAVRPDDLTSQVGRRLLIPLAQR